MTDAAPDYSSDNKQPVQNTDGLNLASSSQYTPSRIESQTYQNLSADANSFNVAQNSALFNRNLYASASFSDMGAYNRAFSQRQDTARLPEITLASADLNPNTSMSRISDVQNTKYDAVLPQVTFTSTDANAGSLDKLSRGALDYIKNNNDQLRRSNARSPYEYSNASNYLPNVSFGPSASAYTFETPTNWQQQQQNAFNGCPCSACASSNYRPENGTRPYQVQPWNQPQGYDPGYVPPNAPAGYGDPRFNDPRFSGYNPAAQYDPRFDQPGQFFPSQTDQYFNNSNRVTPDLMPPGWFDEIYGNGPAPRRPRTNDRPDQPYRPTRPTGDTRYPQGAINRAQFDRELSDPNVMAAFAGRMSTEVGSQGPDAQLAWAETVMNRAASRGISLMAALSGRYYPTPNPGRSNNPAFIQAITKAWQEGTDTTKGSTGNASGSVGFGRGGREIIRINGEKFGMEEVDLNKGWMQKYQQLKFGDRGANPNARPDQPNQPGFENPTSADQITPTSARRYSGLIPEADRMNLMKMALIKCGLPVNDEYIKGLTIIIQKESSWDPNIVNRWDSNWRRGTPSMGLIQTIEPTFRENKMAGFDDILNPLHNMIAGIRYAVKRYGDLLNVPGLRSMRRGGAYRGY